MYHIHLQTFEGCPLGVVNGDVTQLNNAGNITLDELQQAATTCRNISIDQWTVLPNGIRALVMVEDDSPAQSNQSYGQLRSQFKPRALSSFIAGFKAATAKRINLMRGEPGAPVWQRGYSEQKIDDEHTLKRVRQILARSSGDV